MAGYRVEIKRSAAKELDAVASRQARRRLVNTIRALGKQPRPPGCEKLSGHGDRYRVRQGKYRVVFSVDDARRTVLIVKVGHRREVSRKVAGNQGN